MNQDASKNQSKMIILANLTCSKYCVLGAETGTQETKGHPHSQMGRRHTQHLNFCLLPPANQPTNQDLFLLSITDVLSRLRSEEAIWFHHAPSSPVQLWDCTPSVHPFPLLGGCLPKSRKSQPVTLSLLPLPPSLSPSLSHSVISTRCPTFCSFLFLDTRKTKQSVLKCSHAVKSLQNPKCFES